MGADFLFTPAPLALTSRRLSFALATPPLPVIMASSASAAPPAGGAPAFVEDSFFDWAQTDTTDMQSMSFDVYDIDDVNDVVDSLLAEQHLAQAHSTPAPAPHETEHTPALSPRETVTTTTVPAAAAAAAGRKRKAPVAAKAAPPPAARATSRLLRQRATPPVSVPHSDAEEDDEDEDEADAPANEDDDDDEQDEADAPLPRMSVKQMKKYEQMTPAEQAKYRAYRRRNNRASKKSREKARAASMLVQDRIHNLEKENSSLRLRLDEATKQLMQLREIVTRGNMLPAGKKLKF